MKRNWKIRLTAMAVALMTAGSAMTVCAADTYVTKTGDTLSRIAKTVYSSAAQWKAIYESNKDQIKDPNRIWANQTLVLPDSVPTPVAEGATDLAGFLPKLYSLMTVQDYASVLAVDGSAEAEAYVNAMTGDRAVYTPDGSGNGLGVGVYKFGEGVYYFYYGGYAGGERSGDGVIVMSYGEGGQNGSYLFTGTWSGDAPNGNGAVKVLDTENKLSITISGTLVNGLWNDRVDFSIYDANDDYSYDLSFTADHGIAAEDRTQEFVDFLTGEGQELNLTEGHKIISYSAYNGADTWHAFFNECLPSETWGVVGFADREC